MPIQDLPPYLRPPGPPPPLILEIPMLDELPPEPQPEIAPPRQPPDPFLRRQAEWRRAQNGDSGQRFSSW